MSKYIRSLLKITNSDDVTKESIKEHNPNWPQIPNHLYRILIICGSASGKTNASPNAVNQQPDIDNIYLRTKDLFKAKYHLLINKNKSVDLKHFDDPKSFIEYSNDCDYIDQNIDENNPNKKSKILIIFDYMTAYMLNNKKLNPIITKRFIRCKKLKHFSCLYYAILF